MDRIIARMKTRFDAFEARMYTKEDRKKLMLMMDELMMEIRATREERILREREYKKRIKRLEKANTRRG